MRSESQATVQAPRIVLRYFDCRGRAQPLRDALADAELPFVDERIPIGSEWRELKETEAGGPFGCLPVLEWGDDVVSQTLPLASYLARRLGHYDGLDAMQVARLEMVSSSALLDIVFEGALMLWFASRAGPEGEEATFQLHEARIAHKLERLERLLAREPATYFGGQSPAIADFFVFEALDMTRLLFGERLERHLETWPRLAEASRALLARPAFARYLADVGRPDRLTGSPNEHDMRERLRRFVACEKSAKSS
jgi:glutathione S-transferase